MKMINENNSKRKSLYSTTRIVLFLAVCGVFAAEARKYSDTSSNRNTVPPSFDPNTVLNVTVQYGSHAYLVCRVENAGNKSVSWIRKSDGHLLTVDTDTFIGDGRFQVLHPPNSNSWTLHIRGTKGLDAGKYECQVSSEPKQSLVYHLNIVVPLVEIRGAPDIYVMAGSSVVLHCAVSGLIDFPSFILWYHNGQRIAGTALEMAAMHLMEQEPSALVANNGPIKAAWSARVTRLGRDSLLAALTIQSATSDLAGAYSCSPPSLPSAKATLHVLHGEQPAAMQHGRNNAPFTTCSVGVRVLVVFLFCFRFQ